MFAELAKVLQARYQERLLVIGFAETATAVALAVAQGLKNKLFAENPLQSFLGSRTVLWAASHSPFPAPTA